MASQKSSGLFRAVRISVKIRRLPGPPRIRRTGPTWSARGRRGCARGRPPSPPTSRPGRDAVGRSPGGRHAFAFRGRGCYAAPSLWDQRIMNQPSRVPPQAWVVTFAGTAVNLCLGILYAWSVWKANLIAGPDHPAGSPMGGRDEGWSYLTDAQATWAYAICGFIFALFMIPGGRIQDR